MRVLRLLCLLSILVLIEGKIKIEINAGKNLSQINYSGVDIKVANDEELKAFGFAHSKIKETLKTHYGGRKPNSFYVRSPTPWEDLYSKYNWEQVTRVLTIKSAKLKNVSTKPVVVMTHDFDNFSDKPIKINSGLSQTVENTVSTAWTKNSEFTVGQEVEYGLNLFFIKGSGTTSLSHTSSWGRSEEKSETVSIGSSTNVEMELAPGKSVKAVLSANKGDMEIEVVYMAKLRGNVAVNFRRSYEGHHFWAPNVQDLMREAGVENEITIVETVKIGFYADVTLKVYDKETGVPL